MNRLIGIIERKVEPREDERKVIIVDHDSTNISVNAEEINFIEEDQPIEEEDVDYFENEELEDEMADDEEILLEHEEEIYEETTIEQGDYESEAQNSVEMEEYEFEEQQIEYQDFETTEVQAPRPTKRNYKKKSREDKFFLCWNEDCKHRSSFRSAMKKHLRQAHGYDVTDSTCFFCQKTFDLKTEYLLHIKSHTRKSQCEICMMTFLDDEKLAIHQRRVHKSETEDQRNFECEVSSMIVYVELNCTK